FDIPIYCRYVDDILLAIPKDKIVQTFNKFNSYHNRIKFTMEEYEDGWMNFLDIKIGIENEKIIFYLYKKPTNSGRYLNYNSNHPICHKKGTVYSLIDRILLLAHPKFHAKNISELINTLMKNGYPLEFLFATIKSITYQNTSKKKNNIPNNESIDKYFIVLYVHNLEISLETKRLHATLNVTPMAVFQTSTCNEKDSKERKMGITRLNRNDHCESHLKHLYFSTCQTEKSFLRRIVTGDCPNNAGSTYYNYKNSHSVVLLAICDAHYIFSFVDIGACGRRSDGGIFGDSAIGKNFNAGRMNVPKQSAVAGERILPYCLVGDEAFPLKPYLLRPYPGKNGLTLEQDIFNYRLSRARRFIENAFGILVSQWQIFRKPIIAKPENAKLMVQATICLHNWLCKDNIGKNCYVPADMVDEINASDPSTFIPGTWRRIIEDGCAFQDIGNCGSNNSARNCIQIRDEFCDYFFNEGAVPWQNNRHK
ncbi:hypothetical protein ALC62_10346, partial [Cyphomyrmex costatus]